MDVSSEEEEDMTLDEARLSGEDKLVGAEIGADLSPDFKELIEFPPELPAYKVKDENWRMFGLTTFEWRWIEKFMALHRDQVEEDIEEEKRAREYFRLSMFARPEKDVINPWRYHDWEEDLFANLSHTELFGIVRAVHELMISDLYIPLAKWLTLLRGIPRVADFGLGRWLTELSPEMWDSGLEEFCEGAIRPMWDWKPPDVQLA
ncbi:uncharacterized protein LOC110861809 [Folsomia candida]|uniref:uncharacterized protein LOC110861809 n=1 Tax=Folsomia candida TaxID=158441 RepID=UPI000B903D43|nr:uncharacterized protein LOC110861809 [Folsomia candida]